MIHFEQETIVNRLSIYSYTEEYVYNGIIFGILMPVKAEDVMLTDGDPSKSFKYFCDINENLKEADKITIEGEDYIVKTIRKFKLRQLERIEAFVYKPNN